MNFDATRDYQVITDCLAEAELVEHLGLDAIWIAEHHFTGETVYGDAVVFAAALAVKTQRILLGLGVVEMALHNPVQLAIQTALLDNLSRGRLIVGTGRGSNYNAYEYIGFGTDIVEGQKRLPEAEDLLVKAWTTEALEYHGTYWQVTVPAVRPRPYQQPHPPLARACLSEESIRAMARLGAPRAATRARGDAGGGVHPALRGDHARGGIRRGAGRAGPRPVVGVVRGPCRADGCPGAGGISATVPARQPVYRGPAGTRNPKELALPRPRPRCPGRPYAPTPNPERTKPWSAPATGGGAPRAAPSQWRPESHADQPRPALARADAGSLRLLSEQVMPQFRGDAR